MEAALCAYSREWQQGVSFFKMACRSFLYAVWLLPLLSNPKKFHQDLIILCGLVRNWLGLSKKHIRIAGFYGYGLSVLLCILITRKLYIYPGDAFSYVNQAVET